MAADIAFGFGMLSGVGLVALIMIVAAIWGDK